MDVIVRAYMEEDLPRMREIWNEIVDEGIAFPQGSGRQERSWDFISCIPTTWGAAGISAMPAMR